MDSYKIRLQEILKQGLQASDQTLPKGTGRYGSLSGSGRQNEVALGSSNQISAFCQIRTEIFLLDRPVPKNCEARIENSSVLLNR